jgi:hypothetical protein
LIECENGLAGSGTVGIAEQVTAFRGLASGISGIITFFGILDISTRDNKNWINNAIVFFLN